MPRANPAAGTNTSNGSRACCSAMRIGRTTGGSTRGITGGGFGGLSCCCAVTAAGLAWIEAAGFRALPPIDRPTLTIMMYDWGNEADQYAADARRARLRCCRAFQHAWSRLHELLEIAARRSVGAAGRADCRIQPFPPRIGQLSRATVPQRSSRNSLAVRAKTLLPGDGIELLQPVLHRLAEIVAALAERGVALLDEAALLPGQRQRRAMAVGLRWRSPAETRR